MIEAPGSAHHPTSCALKQISPPPPSTPEQAEPRVLTEGFLWVATTRSLRHRPRAQLLTHGTLRGHLVLIAPCTVYSCCSTIGLDCFSKADLTLEYVFARALSSQTTPCQYTLQADILTQTNTLLPGWTR